MKQKHRFHDFISYSLALEGLSAHSLYGFSHSPTADHQIYLCFIIVGYCYYTDLFHEVDLVWVKAALLPVPG